MTMRNPHQTWRLVTHSIQALTRSCITELTEICNLDYYILFFDHALKLWSNSLKSAIEQSCAIDFFSLSIEPEMETNAILRLTFQNAIERGTKN